MNQEIIIIKVPFLGANDTECILVEINAESGTRVEKDQQIGAVETTKTTIEIYSETDGIINWVVETDSELVVGDLMGVITKEIITAEEIQSIIDFESKSEHQQENLNQLITKKAELIAKKHNINIQMLKDYYAGIDKIKETHVEEYLQVNAKNNFQLGFSNLERVVIIGGAGGGGALIAIDSLLRCKNKSPVAVLDQNESFHGQDILGVPVLGTIEKLDNLLSDNKFDSAVIAFNKNLNEREKVFNDLKKKGIKFTNIIDDSVSLRSLVDIGEGNIILGNVYIGSCSIIGNNNFISSNVCLEHGNILGNHCAFGPNVTTSGNVHIGDRVRFATGIVIEPNISIGNDSIISSGSVIRENIDENVVVQVDYHQKNKLLIS